mmetsp:Transcript_17854/g.51116  ORF Transcript_17854/g.51116 Transcript_17854/m.51116 type:complete len:208 (-) Transcript_17854:313-936(-)
MLLLLLLLLGGVLLASMFGRALPPPPGPPAPTPGPATDRPLPLDEAGPPPPAAAAYGPPPRGPPVIMPPCMLGPPPTPTPLLKFRWLRLNRSNSARVAGRVSAGSTVCWLLTSRGRQFRQRPSRTRPWSVIGTILNSFLWKHLRPHVRHSPRFRRCSSSSRRVMTEPVALRSAPSRSMVPMPVGGRYYWSTGVLWCCCYALRRTTQA